jgi:hypothetical protein
MLLFSRLNHTFSAYLQACRTLRSRGKLLDAVCASAEMLADVLSKWKQLGSADGAETALLQHTKK